MSDILYGVAAAQGLIEYDQLAHRVDMQTNHMTWLLAEVRSKAVAEGGPMWTVLCVSARTQRPQLSSTEWRAIDVPGMPRWTTRKYGG
jgi:hypothetical protein